MKPYQQRLAALKLHGSREAAEFEAGLVALLSGKGSGEAADRIIEALSWIVENPRLALPPAIVLERGAAARSGRLLGSLGFRRRRESCAYELDLPRTPLLLDRFRVAIPALIAFKVVAREREDTATTASLKPEPELGAAGTASFILLDGGGIFRRRFASDELFEVALQWARAVLKRQDVELTCVAPRRDLGPADANKTIHSLGMWPGATLQAATDPQRPLLSQAASTKNLGNKPKPSEIFKAIGRRFDTSTPRRTKNPTERRDLLKQTHEAPAKPGSVV